MRAPFDLDAVQAALREAGLDGWLFAQYLGRDPIADRVLGSRAGGLQTRRWYYLIPAQGPPRGLVHAVEPDALAGLPGGAVRYRTWQELEAGLAGLLEGLRVVAMQYAPRNRLPYVATVDAGTLELVRGLGLEVVSSADLVQRFTATLSDAQLDSHRRAARRLERVVLEALLEARSRLLAGRELAEDGLQAFIVARLRSAGLRPGDAPIVAVNANSADPHYVPRPGRASPIGKGDWLLLDVWAREPAAGSVFADQTWVAQVDDGVPERAARAFAVVREARDAVVALVVDRYRSGQPVRGCEADRAAREVIEAAGYGAAVRHRTGHSITDEVHGSGANLDDFETRDDRLLLRRTCFSVEPGIYLEGDFGVRSEINVLIPPEGLPEVSCRRQRRVIPLLAGELPEELAAAGDGEG